MKYINKTGNPRFGTIRALFERFTRPVLSQEEPPHKHNGSLCEYIWHILVTKGLERFGVRELASMSAAGRDLCKLRELRRWCRALPGGHHARSRPSSA